MTGEPAINPSMTNLGMRDQTFSELSMRGATNFELYVFSVFIYFLMLDKFDINI